MIALGALDPAALGTLGVLCASIIGGIVGLRKVRPEAESIATKTTLEVNEALREELADRRQEAEHLRGELRQRDSEMESLQRRFARLRLDFDALEAELNALRGTPGPSGSRA